jgi:alpha-galactosidase
MRAAGIQLAGVVPLVDGEPPACEAPTLVAGDDVWTLTWKLAEGSGRSVVLRVRRDEAAETRAAGAKTQAAAAESRAPPAETRLPAHERAALVLDIALEGVRIDERVDSLGLRFGAVSGVLRYLRNGYTSWDGSYFVEPANADDLSGADAAASNGYAMTALVDLSGGTAVLGFVRHDRYQSRVRFAFATEPGCLDIETLIDRVPHSGRIEAESLVLLAGTEVEETLRQWARRVARVAPLPPRLPFMRIAGWCSWYSLYASISEPLLLDHLRAAARFRARYRVPFEIFQIDDGFVPEMGDWLDVKPQFPRGMAPLLADIKAAGFVPGLWIAPFMVGNRSRLYSEHPDWVVADRETGKPLAPMKFYGEFRWHKRSEEYYVLDITHPKAEAYIRNVFRTWTKEWGCGYFKTDFMYFGSEYGPAQARWHQAGLSRMEIWMRMARLIREEIGESLWLGCGGPIWAPVGLVDAVRIGRDIGVSWRGHYSAESLLRDQTSRNFANGILWQADPDCILLRDRFHDLTATEVSSLARFAGLSGGVLMTSDQLDEVPEDRRALFASFADNAASRACDFPLLGQGRLTHRTIVGHAGQPAIATGGDPVLIQRVRHSESKVVLNVFNTGDTAVERLVPWRVAGVGSDWALTTAAEDLMPTRTQEGLVVSVPPHGSCLLTFSRVQEIA